MRVAYLHVVILTDCTKTDSWWCCIAR